MVDALGDVASASSSGSITDASHELRTPLTSLRTNTELLGRADDARGPSADRGASTGCSSRSGS